MQTAFLQRKEGCFFVFGGYFFGGSSLILYFCIDKHTLFIL